MRLLNRCNSWNNTIVVGVISGQSARRILTSHKVYGSLLRISLAVDSINYSRLIPPPEMAEANCIKSRFSQFNFAEFVK